MKWVYKPFCRFPSNCSPHRLGPDTCCSLLELNAVDWSNVGRKASDQEGCLRATAIWRQLCGFTRTAASTQTDSIDMKNNLESMKGGRATDGDTHELVVASALSSCLPNPRDPPLLVRQHSASCRCGATSSSENFAGRVGVPCVLQVR